ncbi:sigma-70 family RNA polymerase sigma factor [Pimelobacter simplex]|uniref:Putative RNA polymerase sigma factor n=1 Tax=Nocardioides simplex TaxID=2045 RepID=A0A0A1DQ62_NOCSI|nr:sigma-70 family RNA polymerase sigma factor [Pimelobacter simplex]AIY19541.1 putative RNA polymerase sigma factor [Pimelobacter simplex]MCG8150793.1 sigma-70 family RNA polymerase sigma factor [Pimelobacter simplex]GEB15313.1 DNA-directed RNA polymerase sigma-70 factor [Pimelobacter simplex]SFM83728.1 RNA polymerase sigma-70 factor, ECF subfamily [Pimelobacter simplex]
MNDDVTLAEAFEQHRRHLHTVAYRVLGSVAEAEDAVQEAWLRLHRSDAAEIDNLGGWLTTVVGRIALNTLRSRATRREDSLEERAERLPDPVITRVDDDLPLSDRLDQPEQQALLADSVGLALLVVLDQLGPAERIAFVLHDLFGVPFEEIAPVVERTPAATRQLASRARRRVRGSAAADPDDPRRQREVVDAFFAAARDGDLARLVGVLAPDVVLRSDSGALYRGAERIASNALMFAHPDRVTHPVLVNGQAGVVITLHGELFSVMAFTVVAGRIVEIETYTEPEQLERVRAAGVASGT